MTSERPPPPGEGIRMVQPLPCRDAPQPPPPLPRTTLFSARSLSFQQIALECTASASQPASRDAFFPLHFTLSDARASAFHHPFPKGPEEAAIPSPPLLFAPRFSHLSTHSLRALRRFPAPLLLEKRSSRHQGLSDGATKGEAERKVSATREGAETKERRRGEERQDEGRRGRERRE